MELASVTVKIKIGKSVQEAHVDDRLDPVQIARIVGRRPEGLQIIHKGRRLAAGDVVPAGATLMVLGGGGDSGDTELSLGSDSGSSAQGGASLADFEATNRWVLAINANEEWLPLNRGPVARPLRRLLPMSVYRFVEALLGLVVATVRAVLPLGWLDPRPASAAATAPGQRHIAAPGREIELSVVFGAEAGVARPGHENMSVSWTVQDCGTLLTPAQQEFPRSIEAVAKATLRSSGQAGLVTCTVCDPATNTTSSHHFYFEEHPDVA